MRWLIVRLEAPLASFGGIAIDSRGVTRDFPALSAVTGLLGNALGYERTEGARLERLQERVVFGARREHEPTLGRMSDFQTVRFGRRERGWTTVGMPEERGGSSETHANAHIRNRDYHADTRMTLVLRLVPEDDPPTLDDIAAALDRPARPLFFGRKPCLPSGYLLAPGAARWIDAPDARAALTAIPGDRQMRALWPDGADHAASGARRIADRRNWRSGLHGGTRAVEEGVITPVGAA